MSQNESERPQFASGGNNRPSHPVRGILVHYSEASGKRLKNVGEIIQIGGKWIPRKACALVMYVRPMLMNHARLSDHVIRPRDSGDS
jgi:hypothetical protein